MSTSPSEISSTAGQQDGGKREASLQSLNENSAALSTSPLEEKASENSKENVDTVVQQESRPNAKIEDMLETFTNAIARENNRHSQNLTAVLTSKFEELAMAIQNPNMSKVVTPVNEKLNQSCSQNEAGKEFYDTSGKRGLLFILQFEDSLKWKNGNANDLKVLNEFFKATLGFDVRSYNTYSELDAELKQMSSTEHNFYCLMICISGHGDKNSVCIKLKTNGGVTYDSKTTIDEIKERISNETIPTLSGVPKILFIDTCRGSKDNSTVPSQKKSVPISPTTDSDCITINTTTLGRTGNILDKGSVGIQGVMEIFQKNWKKDHLEEMLIDARMNVATWGSHNERQILEIQTTLLKRLLFK